MEIQAVTGRLKEQKLHITVPVVLTQIVYYTFSLNYIIQQWHNSNHKSSFLHVKPSLKRHIQDQIKLVTSVLRTKTVSLLPILILPNKKLETSLHERYFHKTSNSATEKAQINLSKIHPEVCYLQILYLADLCNFCLCPCRDMSVDFAETMMAMEIMTSLLAVSLWQEMCWSLPTAGKCPLVAQMPIVPRIHALQTHTGKPGHRSNAVSLPVKCLQSVTHRYD